MMYVISDVAQVAALTSEQNLLDYEQCTHSVEIW